MRVSRLVYLGLIMLLSMLVLPMATTAQGNSDAAHACQQGGYVNYTDVDGNGFKNAGQCTKYEAQGGTLVPVPTTELEILLVQSCDTIITGTGLLEGTTLTWYGVLPDSGASSSTTLFGTLVQPDGTYYREQAVSGWSNYYVTGTTSAGETITSNTINEVC